MNYNREFAVDNQNKLHSDLERLYHFMKKEHPKNHEKVKIKPNQYESLLAEVAIQVDLNTFIIFAKNKNLENCAIKINNSTLNLLKAGNFSSQLGEAIESRLKQLTQYDWGAEKTESQGG